MSFFEFDSPAYLKRLGLTEDVPPTADGLRTLQRAQLHAIPFENFDIHLGRGVDLSPDRLFDKLVNRQRGGYCFELNGLFLMALQAFGFQARPLLARVQHTGTPSGRGHQLSLVRIDGTEWVADVGFGKDNPLEPLPLELETVRNICGQPFRLMDGGVFGTMLQKLVNDTWQNLYSFDMEHVCDADIAYGNHYTSTSAHTFFTTARVAMLPRDDGWVSLFNHRLTLHRNGREELLRLPQGQEYLDGLQTYFGIALDAPYKALKPVDQD